MSDTKVLIYRQGYGLLSETFVRDHVHGLKRHRPVVLTNELHRSAPTRGEDLHVVPARSRPARWLADRGFSPGMDQVLRQAAPALVHAHFLIDAAKILPYARRRGLPLVVTAHGYDATLYPEAMKTTPEGRLLLERQQALMDYAARIVCVSDYIRDELIARGYPAARLTTIPLGVDTTALVPPPADGERSGIMTVGRLVEKKGTRFLIEAYARLPEPLRERHPLTIIGDGPLRPVLEQQAADLGVAVTFMGGLSHHDILGHLARAALFCFPSIRAATGDAEGMGIAIMEALALETPVVLFDDQPAAPILKAADCGIVTPPRDGEALARGLAQVLEDAPAAADMARRGRALCENTFNFASNLALLEDCYEQVRRDHAAQGR